MYRIARLFRRNRHKPATIPQPLPGPWWLWLAAGIFLALAVAGITGIISYEHGLYIAHVTGNAGLVAALLPLVPDLAIAMSSLVLVVASAIGAGYPPSAIAALAVGIGWTVAQNVAAGWHNGAGGAILAGGIPVAFVLTVELLLWLVRNVRRTQPATTASHAQPVTREAALTALLATDAERPLAAFLGIDRNRVQTWKREMAEVAAAPSPNGSGSHG